MNKRPVSSDEEDDPELEDEDEDEEVVDERLAVEGDESPATLAELAQVEVAAWWIGLGITLIRLTRYRAIGLSTH